MMRGLTLIAIGILLVAGGYKAGSLAPRPEPPESTPPAWNEAPPRQAPPTASDEPTTTLDPATAGEPGPEPRTLAALVVPREWITVRADLAGRIAELPVDEGTEVAAGQTLVRLDEEEARVELERQSARLASARNLVVEAEALLEQARDERRRNARLAERHLLDQSTLVAGELRVKARAARLAALREDVAGDASEERRLRLRLGRHAVAAPFTGHVTEVVRHAGQFVQQGDAILRVESRPRWLKVNLPPGLAESAELPRFQLLAGGTWRRLTPGPLRPHLNPDGTRTLFLAPPGEMAPPTGQTVTIHVVEGREAQP